MSDFKFDPSEASERAESMRANPDVIKWMKRARRLFKDQPEGTWIYWQENQMHLMVLGPNGERYVNSPHSGAGSETRSSVYDITVPGSDCGGW